MTEPRSNLAWEILRRLRSLGDGEDIIIQLSELGQLVDNARRICKIEPNITIAEIPPGGRLTLVGDIHGSLPSLKAYYEIYTNAPGRPVQKYSSHFGTRGRSLV